MTALFNKGHQPEEEDEDFHFFVESSYNYDGSFEARVLDNDARKALGYFDGLVKNTGRSRIYVDGFSSEEAARSYMNDLEGNIAE